MRELFESTDEENVASHHEEASDSEARAQWTAAEADNETLQEKVDRANEVHIPPLQVPWQQWWPWCSVPSPTLRPACALSSIWKLFESFVQYVLDSVTVYATAVTPIV